MAGFDLQAFLLIIPHVVGHNYYNSFKPNGYFVLPKKHLSFFFAGGVDKGKRSLTFLDPCFLIFLMVGT